MPRGKTSFPSPTEPIRLMVVEPRALVGVGVREVLDRESDIEVVAQVRSPEEAISVVDEAAPDVILVNVPHVESSLAESRRLRLETPDASLVLLGGDDDDSSIIGAVEIGASAHVAELAGPAELVSVIRRVAKGDDLLKDELIGRPDLVERIIDSVRETLFAEQPPVNPLTHREIEVLRLIARGWRNRDIATALSIRDQTVKNHITGILHKLGVPNRTRAAIYAMRHGWLDVDDVPDPAEAPLLRQRLLPSGRARRDVGGDLLDR